MKYVIFRDVTYNVTKIIIKHYDCEKKNLQQLWSQECLFLFREFFSFLTQGLQDQFSKLGAEDMYIWILCQL